MAPFPLGIMALAGVTSGGAFDLLETVTLSTDTEGLIFSGIPQTYKHLQIRQVLRGSGTPVVDNTLLRFNADNGTNYANHALYGNGASSVFNTASSSANVMNMADIVGGGAEANAFTAQVMDILDYSSTTKYKTARALSGHPTSGDNDVRLTSGLWQSTAGITSITFLVGGGETYAAGSRFSLYGVK